MNYVNSSETNLLDCTYSIIDHSDNTEYNIPITCNKKSCGCGLTTHYLTSYHSCIIVVPNTINVTSKIGRYPNVLLVSKGVTIKAISNYVTKSIGKYPPKILTTAASFSKVVSAISSEYLSSMSLIIDESELRLNPIYASAYASVYASKDEFLRVVEFSATPYESDCLFTFDRLDKDFKFINIKDSKIGKFAYAINHNYCRKREQFIFVNSVKLINVIITNLGIPDNKVTINVSDNELNKLKLSNYTINVTKPDALITISTSTSYRSMDMKAITNDPTVLIYSNVDYGYTAMDWSELYQIAGRVRNIETTPILFGYLKKRSLVTEYNDCLRAEKLFTNGTNLSTIDKAFINPYLVDYKFNYWYKSELESLLDQPAYTKVLNVAELFIDDKYHWDLGINPDYTYNKIIQMVYQLDTTFTVVNNIITPTVEYISTTGDSSINDSIYYKVALWLRNNNYSIITATKLIEDNKYDTTKILRAITYEGCTEDWCKISTKGKAVGKAVGKAKKVKYQYLNVLYNSKKEIGEVFGFNTSKLDTLTRNGEITKVK